MKRFLTPLLCALLVIPAFAQKTYKNPVYGSDFPDPTVVRAADGTFYSYATGCKAKKSTDLVKWTDVSGVISRPTWNDSTYIDGEGNKKTDYYSLWAADVSYVDGKYVCFYASALWGNGSRTGIGVAVGDTPTKFTDKGKVFRSTEIGVKNSIDPCYVEEFDKKYLVWGSFNDICIVELTDDALAVKNFNPINNPQPGGGWTRHKGVTKLAGGAFEGAMIYKRGQYYYLFCSVGSCCEGENSTYRTVVGRSTKLMGPYTNKQGGAMTSDNYTTILKGNEGSTGRWKGPGHNSEIITDDNGDDWLLYHSYDRNNNFNGRLMLLDKITWSKDGWPSINDGYPSSDEMPAPVFYTGDGANVTYKFQNMDLMKSGWKHWTLNASENCETGSGKGTAFMPLGYAKTAGSFDVQQTVSGVKNGVYELTLEDFSTLGGVDLFVNNTTVPAYNTTANDVAAPTSESVISSNFLRNKFTQKVYGLVTNGRLTIGARTRDSLATGERFYMGNLKVVFREKNQDAMQGLMDMYAAMLDSIKTRGQKHYAGFDASMETYKQQFAASENTTERYNLLTKTSKTIDSIQTSIEDYTALDSQIIILKSDIEKAIQGGYLNAEAQAILTEAEDVAVQVSYNTLQMKDLLTRMQTVAHDMIYAYQKGDGTKDNPYIISRPEQLDNMHNVLVREQMVYFEMDADVDMAGFTWEQLNTSSNSYRYWITLDGKGHIIYNLTPEGSKNYPSFFGILCGEIRNVGFVNAKVEASASGAGVICGYMGHSTFKDAEENLYPVIVENCYVTGEITSKGYVGAIGGTLNSSPIIIRNCYSAVNIVGNGASANYSGGLVGRIRSDLTIENCYAAGTINSPVAGGVVAGARSNTNPPSIYNNVIAWNPSVAGKTASAFGETIEGDVLQNIYILADMTVNDVPVEGGKTHGELQQIAGTWGSPWYKDPAAGNGYPILQWQYERGDYRQICGFPEDEETSLGEELRVKNEEFAPMVYDLSGRKINSKLSTLNSQLKKGIYIINGKKVMY
ncbi:MAG: family 43 glycosylhydrolase [Bacteroidaceae bacterium]|nr:family 43 glycosylhydrolase [Bacteroidaceae bacterium]